MPHKKIMLHKIFLCVYLCDSWNKNKNTIDKHNIYNVFILHLLLFKIITTTRIKVRFYHYLVLPKPPLRFPSALSDFVIPNLINTPCKKLFPAGSSNTASALRASCITLASICPSLS